MATWPLDKIAPPTPGTHVTSVNGQVGAVTLTIPSAQVNTDWNSLSGISQLLNKPTLFSGAYADLSGKPVLFSGNYTDLTNKPTLFDGTYASLSGKPTTLSGYGITDGITASGLTSTLSNYATTSALTSGLSAKFNTPAGNTNQYVRGDGTLAAFPTNVSSFTNDSNYLTTITSGQVTTALGFTPYNATNPSNYINQAEARSAISLTTTGSNGAASYSSSTGVVNIPNYTPSQSTASRSLNTAFQVNTTRPSLVTYSVQITVTATISGGQNGDIILEIASDSGFTTNVQTVSIFGVGQTYTLAVALSGVQPLTGIVSGVVPSGYYARLRTVNNTGTPTYSFRSGQEVTL